MSDLIVIYLGIWVVVTVALFTVTSHFCDFRSPAPHPFGLSLLGGAIWPVLLLGAAEFSSVAMCAKVQSKATPEEPATAYA